LGKVKISGVSSVLIIYWVDYTTNSNA